MDGRGNRGVDRNRPVVPREHPADHRDGGRDPREGGGVPQGGGAKSGRVRALPSPDEGERLLRPSTLETPRGRRGRRSQDPVRRGGAGGLQAGRHLRGGVRGAHPVPLLDVRARERGEPDRPEEGGDPRRRSEPDRPGDRVRLLLRPRRLRPARGRVRDDHGELQPRDRLHRLRLLRPPLLRAPDEGGRPRHHRGGEAGRRDRPVRRPDPAEARRPPRSRRESGSSGLRRRASTGRKIASGSPRC